MGSWQGNERFVLKKKKNSFVNNVILKEDKPENILRPFVMVWTVRTQFWGLQPWPALCVRSCSYSTSFRKRKRRKSSFPECWLCSSHCSQWFTWLVSFKCHYHAVNQKLLCLFLRWTEKLSTCPGIWLLTTETEIEPLLFTPKPMFFVLQQDAFPTFAVSESWSESVGRGWSQELMRHWGKATWDGLSRRQSRWSVLLLHIPVV